MDTQSGAGAAAQQGQPDLVQLRAVSEADLAAFENTKEAERLRRLEGDRDMVLQLGLNGYQGPSWKQFSEALVAYAFQVLRAWARSGLIFLKCAEKRVGLPCPEGAEERLRDDAPGVAAEAIAKAIPVFRDKVLIKGRWDPTKGASLKTFFVGQCLFQFANVYRSWLVEQDFPEVSLDTLRAQVVNLERKLGTDELAELLRRASTLVEKSAEHMRVLKAMGFDHAEIAEIVGTEPSARAVEGKLYRERQRQHRRMKP